MFTVSEVTLNIALAQLLSERGLKAVGEAQLKKPCRARPDVIIVVNGVKIIVEGKIGSGKLKQAIEKCEERIDNGLADICVALEYIIPEDRLQIANHKEAKDTLLRSRFNVVFISYLDRANLTAFIPNWRRTYRNYSNIDFNELVRYLLQCYTETVGMNVVQYVVDKIDATLNQFSGLANNKSLVERLKEVLELYK